MDNENNGTPEVPSGDAETPPPTVGIHDNCTAKMVELQQTIANLRAEINTLRTEQIDGSDPRLADFWEKAQRFADDGNYCEIFDQIADALGGPRRIREYEVVVSGTVTVPWSITVTVEATDEDEARENAEEKVDYRYSADDLEDYANWYDADDMNIDNVELA